MMRRCSEWVFLSVTGQYVLDMLGNNAEVQQMSVIGCKCVSVCLCKCVCECV